MKSLSRALQFVLAVITASLLIANVSAQTPMDGRTGQQGRHHGMGGGHQRDMQTIHALFADHTKITRTVKNIRNGVETQTESSDPKTVALIVEHAYAMKARLEKRQPIRQWDPLFAELFKYADKIRLEITQTERGVKVTETSDDAYVVKLIQSHAQGVSDFVKDGMAGMHKRHELPDATDNK